MREDFTVLFTSTHRPHRAGQTMSESGKKPNGFYDNMPVSEGENG